jgi:hypothetical protein
MRDTSDELLEIFEKAAAENKFALARAKRELIDAVKCESYEVAVKDFLVDQVFNLANGEKKLEAILSDLRARKAISSKTEK